LASAASGIEGERVVDADVRPREGESLRQLYDRVRAFVDDVDTDALKGDVVVVTHGGVIRVAHAYDSGVDVDAMSWGPVPNASVWSLGRPCPASAVVQ
jgi:broad specificity phosphatase PhoE